MQLPQIILGCLFAVVPALAVGQEAGRSAAQTTNLPPGTSEILLPSKGTTSFVLKPVLVDAESSSGATLALEYDLKVSRIRPFGGRTSVGSDRVTPSDADVTIREGELLLRARGTLASSKAKNPHSMLDFSATGFIGFSRPEAYYRLGAQATYETDQSLDDRQYSLGAVGAVTKVSTFTNGDAGTIILGYASVNPIDDDTRQRLIGNLENFRRWNAEISYSYPINRTKVRSVDLNYRLYREIDAPVAIALAGLDKHQLWLVRLNLDEGFFLQYSKGSLPFDQREVRSVKAGWALKLE